MILVTNAWTKPALHLLDDCDIDSVGLERCWDAIRDEMRRIEEMRGTVPKDAHTEPQEPQPLPDNVTPLPLRTLNEHTLGLSQLDAPGGPRPAKCRAPCGPQIHRLGIYGICQLAPGHDGPHDSSLSP